MSIEQDEWKDNIDPFKKVFFEQREKLRKIDLNSWIDLHPVFDDVIQVMKILDNENRLYIATLKDSTSVRLILNKQGLKITNNKLLDQSQIETKLQALDIFRNKVGCDKSDMIFVDDNVTHLSRPKSAGYPVYLAVWGNTIDEYLKIAQTSAIDTLGDCYELL